MAPYKLAIFDVDGTLTPQRPFSTAPFQRTLLPNVASRLAQLHTQGVILAAATNQGGLCPIGKQGWRDEQFSVGTVLAHLGWLQREWGFAAVRFASSRRKKPAPTMLFELMRQFQATPAETLFVGDQATDEQAAKAAGVAFCFAASFFQPSSDGRFEACLESTIGILDQDHHAKWEVLQTNDHRNFCSPFDYSPAAPLADAACQLSRPRSRTGGRLDCPRRERQRVGAAGRGAFNLSKLPLPSP